ncbi:MAG: hypothetical protein WCL00_13170, partial [Bacteroidota bacterium]
KLAKQFIPLPSSIDLQLFTPDNLFKFNHKGEEIEHFSTMSAAQQDSALYSRSLYMQFVNDSSFMERYINSFIDELRAFGFAVYLDHEVDSLLQRKPQSYIVNISQVQLDEYTFPLEDSEPYGDSVLYKSFQLNGVDLSSWFELSKINAKNPRKTVLYSSFNATDGFEGRFVMNPMTNGVRYKYKVDTLNMKDLTNLAVQSGKQNADYLFDYFMNQYILHNLPENTEPRGWYHYDRIDHSFSITESDMFEVLPEK